MVRVTSPTGKSAEDVRDDVGQIVTDGLEYDDAGNQINELTGGLIEISGTNSVQVTERRIRELSQPYAEGYAPEFTG